MAGEIWLRCASFVGTFRPENISVAEGMKESGIRWLASRIGQFDLLIVDAKRRDSRFARRNEEDPVVVRRLGWLQSGRFPAGLPSESVGLHPPIWCTSTATSFPSLIDSRSRHRVRLSSR